jgi:hypothetical protein
VQCQEIREVQQRRGTPAAAPLEFNPAAAGTGGVPGRLARVGSFCRFDIFYTFYTFSIWAELEMLSGGLAGLDIFYTFYTFFEIQTDFVELGGVKSVL